MTSNAENNFPHADTKAAAMLRSGLARLKGEKGVSARTVAARLGYKQPVVLSHMASGRVPIPIDRVEAIAKEVCLDPAAFLLAAIDQRLDGRARQLLAQSQASDATGFVTDLQEIAGEDLATFTPAKKQVLREVVADPDPSRRWLSLSELPVVQMLRRKFPHIQERGLSATERQELFDLI